jgi:hypothetical protein
MSCMRGGEFPSHYTVVFINTAYARARVRESNLHYPDARSNRGNDAVTANLDTDTVMPI